MEVADRAVAEYAAMGGACTEVALHAWACGGLLLDAPARAALARGCAPVCGRAASVRPCSPGSPAGAHAALGVPWPRI